MTVYVVQEPRGINLTPAEQYGELKVLLPPGNVAYSTGPTVSRLKRGLATYADSDYLLMVGDPSAIAVAGAVVSKPMPKKTTCLSGLSRAICTASSGE